MTRPSCKFLIHGNRCFRGLAEPEQLPQACDTCPKYRVKLRGMGDVVHSVAEVTGVAAIVHHVAGTNCGCQQRREALNAMMPFGKDEDGTS